MRKYRAAIIGCGRIGSEFDRKFPKENAFSHAGAYIICPATELVAASDSDRWKLAAFSKKWQIDSIYEDYKQMLRNERIDILSICTPPKTHRNIIEYAANFPIKAIYCEKPIAANTKDAKEMIHICKKRNIPLFINHQRRFGPFFKELKQKLHRNYFGKIQHINCHYTRGIYNTGTHLIDMFSYLFGRVIYIKAYKSTNISPFKNDPNLDVVMRFKNGVLLTMKGCDDSYYLIFEIDILAQKARIVMADELKYFKAAPGKNLLKRKELMEDEKLPFKFTYPRYAMTGLNFGVRHIADCLDKKEKPLSTGEDGLYTLSLIDKILKSAREKREIFNV